MADSEKRTMPIGAVTQLTGISGHTLRKWESRYAAVAPARTESGRRLYTQQQVRKLIRLRDLIRQGYQIGQLSAMSEAELEALTDEQPPLEVGIDRVIVVGEVLAAVLAPQLPGDDATLIPEAGGAWLVDPQVTAERGKQALVIELPTVTEAALGSLARLRKHIFARVIVVYGFASRKTLSRLADAGVLCLKAPVDATEVLRNLSMADQSEGATSIEALNRRHIPARRFSSQAIASLAALSPELQCECPHHIAQLVLDISAFEQYSLECEQSDPQERALHARLRSIAAHARALFEEAMANVAAHEGLQLEEL
ncbi:MAG: MerR family transcriptional regulator [Gammaproteobacteria bacterium]|nr:MerR family transcriptional regulator [Gammaproteobacteria bacterium]